jgi:hypothetical protein
MTRPRRRPAPRPTPAFRVTRQPRREGPNAVVLALGGIALLGAGALLATAVFLLGRGSGSPAPTPAPSGPPALPAGTYQSRAFQPQVSFTLPDGWWIASDGPAYLALQPVETDLAGIHLFRDPSAMSQDPTCPQTAEPGVGKLSTDLATWIRGRPGFVTSNPRLAEVGGLRGIELDVGIAQTWTTSCPFANGLPAVPLFVSSDGFRWVVAGSEQLRLTLLDLPGGGTVVVDIDAFDGSLMSDLVTRATPIVRSFEFAAPAASGTPTSSPVPGPTVAPSGGG